MLLLRCIGRSSGGSSGVAVSPHLSISARNRGLWSWPKVVREPLRRRTAIATPQPVRLVLLLLVLLLVLPPLLLLLLFLPLVLHVLLLLLLLLLLQLLLLLLLG